MKTRSRGYVDVLPSTISSPFSSFCFRSMATSPHHLFARAPVRTFIVLPPSTLLYTLLALGFLVHISSTVYILPLYYSRT